MARIIEYHSPDPSPRPPLPWDSIIGYGIGSLFGTLIGSILAGCAGMGHERGNESVEGVVFLSFSVHLIMAGVCLCSLIAAMVVSRWIGRNAGENRAWACVIGFVSFLMAPLVDVVLDHLPHPLREDRAFVLALVSPVAGLLAAAVILVCSKPEPE